MTGATCAVEVTKPVQVLNAINDLTRAINRLDGLRDRIMNNPAPPTDTVKSTEISLHELLDTSPKLIGDQTNRIGILVNEISDMLF